MGDSYNVLKKERKTENKKRTTKRLKTKEERKNEWKKERMNERKIWASTRLLEDKRMSEFTQISRDASLQVALFVNEALFFIWSLFGTPCRYLFPRILESFLCYFRYSHLVMKIILLASQAW